MKRTLLALLSITSIQIYSSLAFAGNRTPVKVAVLDWGLLKKDNYNKSITKMQSVYKSRFVAGVAPLHSHGSIVIDVLSSYGANEIPNPNETISGMLAPNKVTMNNSQLYKNYSPSILFYGINDSGVSPEYNDVTENGAKAVYLAIESGVKVINLSFGGYNSFSLSEYKALKKASDAGIIIVTAAGNDGKELNSELRYFPCNLKIKNLICVGALKNGNVAKYSNYGSDVSVFANGDSSSGESGTSFAAPRITRAVALAMQNGNLSASRVLEKIKESVVPTKYSNGLIINKFSEESFARSIFNP